MPIQTSKPANSLAVLWPDLALVAFLIGLDVVARLLPHAPGFLPVAASGLFAARYLRLPALAIVVPVLAMTLALARGLGEPEHLLAFYGEAARERIRRVAPGSRAALALAAPDFMRK